MGARFRRIGEAFALRFGRALLHRNYRLFFGGQSISLAGTWLTRFATVWMVYRLTKSPVMLGLVGFFGQAPAALLAPIAGVLVDRWDRKRTVIVTQIAAMLQSAALAFFALTGTMTVWHLLALGAVQAVINAFDTVGRQSFLGQMVGDRSDLASAVALNSFMVNAARMLGPVFAAALVAAFGEGWCFTLDALSYVAVIASLFAMRVEPREVAPRTRAVREEMKEGFGYVAELPVVRSVLLLFATTSILAVSYTPLLPLIAGGTLNGGPHTLGMLMGSEGLGAITGAFLLATRASRDARTNSRAAGVAARSRMLSLLAACSIGLGAGLALLELARSVAIAVPILFVVGGCWMVQSVATNTVVQTSVEPSKLGRVMSLVAVAFFGGAPIGALLEGELAKLVGPVHMFAIAGACCIACGLSFVRSLPRLREASSDDPQPA